MRNVIMKTHKKLILMLLLGTTCTVSCSDLLKDYKLDTDPDFLKSMTLLDYIAQGRDTTLTLYAEAVAYADLNSIISEGNKTRVVPTNSAIRTVLTSAGVSRLQDLPANVVRGLFSYLTFSGAFRSIDLEENETIEGESLSGEPMFLTRVVSSTDKYRLVVNRSNQLGTPPIDVIRQDYVFKDGIAHVVNYFPTYQKAITPTDPVPEGVDYSEAKQDRILVTGETHVYEGGKNTNYDTQSPQLVARSGVRRYTFFRFDDLPAIDYVDDLVSARLRFRVRQINGSNYEPICGVYETTHSDWTAPTLTWNNMPGFGQEIATGTLTWNGTSAGVWNEINITGYVQNAYQEGKSVISLALQALNGANITSSSVQIWHSETSNGVYRQSIELMGPIPSEMEINSTSPVAVENNGIVTLTKEHFSMSGSPSSQYTYTDNNILFALIESPTNGTLTKYGIPMKKYTQFTQEELSNGAIKYVHNSGGSDTFQLKALDYIGGVYSDLLPISVTVQ